MIRPIPNFPDYYVSVCGSVISTKGKEPRVLRAKKEAVGYRRVNIMQGVKVLSKRIHVLVALAFIGPRPLDHDVDHINHEREDNRLHNLRYLHKSENRADGGRK